MSETTDTVVIPEWTLAWRMKRSLAHAGITVEQMAAEIGVSRSTVSGWINDHGAEPRVGYLKLWAIRCGVPLEWLVSGGVSSINNWAPTVTAEAAA